jgi:hypothetical protein
LGAKSFLAGETDVSSQFFFYLEQAIIFGYSLAAAGSAGFYQAGANGDCQVSYCGIFGLAGAMAYYGCPANLLRSFYRRQGFAECAHLIRLYEDSIGCLLGNASFQPFEIGGVEVIANEFDLLA